MTPLWTALDLLEATGGTMPAPFAAAGVSIDSRTLAPGDLFIALHGEAGDGHDHVEAALAKGAAGAMVDRDSAGETLLRVDDTLAGLTRMGGYGRARFTGRLVAVTGSVGKTTTKEMLRTILAARAPTHAAVASYNNQWGLPLTLARLPPDAAFCVAEIGMNHAGEIEPLARLAAPHVAVITTIERAHIGFLGSIEAIADEKAAILRGLQPGGIAVLPADSALFPRLHAAAAQARVVTFGTDIAADACLETVEADAEGTDMRARVNGETIRVRIAAPGRHMAMNATAALAAAAALGIRPAAAAAALHGFAPVTGRGARRRIEVPGGDALLLDESYNGNGASMRAALSVLRLQPARRRIAVLGDMLELGEYGPAEHIGLAAEVAASADLLFACGPLMRLLYDSVPQAMRGGHAANAAALAELVGPTIRPGDVILVKGSLGNGMKLVVAALDRLTEVA
ncbi:MAG TPA: UDP-N-acetylmuramoyl-tripeptide--D-alanyl-D-alanine ligase [Acetobacteraceae bacterium]|nr:UDP-N-acetylmuramoyl-tripeptide--D-alanyl-D-alanine ligase [Acetobacteraceae bacterium]